MDLQTVTNFICEYFTKENVTFLFAVVGFAGTIYAAFASRVKIDMKIIKYIPAKGQIIIYAAFQNKSHMAVSISGISVKIDDVYFPCVEYPTIIEWNVYRSKNEITGTFNLSNMDMPINLTALSGTSGYILFEVPQEDCTTAPNTLTFQLSPNRGRAVEKKCQLPHCNIQ